MIRLSGSTAAEECIQWLYSSTATTNASDDLVEWEVALNVPWT